MGYVVFGDRAPSAEGLGGKVNALWRLSQTDLCIPGWMALKPQAFYDSLSDHQAVALARTQEPAQLSALLDEVALSPQVAEELGAALQRLCPDGKHVAVRSSALDEDGDEHSFAGQLESFLFVAPTLEAVTRAVIGVWRSGFEPRVWAYRRERGLPVVPRAPAVLIQRMVNAQAAGVAFSADPVSGRHAVAVVAAVLGLGEALVSGDSDADTYHVDGKARIIKRKIARKQVAQRFDPEHQCLNQVAVPDGQAVQPALSDAQVRAVAAMARDSARFFKRPQDIEWALEDGQLYLLQSRPITSLGERADPDGVLTVWDNSNIAESYGGITSPLTFSFARRAYEEVYRQFCRVLRVPASVIRENDDVFARMLGLIRGRVYYNMLSWYRVLAMLPGFKTNRAFMEQMMGVKEGVPDALLPQAKRLSFGQRLQDRWCLVGSIAGLVIAHFTLPRRIHQFYGRLEGALGSGRPDLSGKRPDELVAYYRQLERQLLTRWDAPLVNDFFAMVFYGVLRKLCGAWCQDEDGTLQNNLLCGEGGMISTEPAQRMRAMAKVAAAHDGLVSALQHGSPRRVRAQIEKHPEFKAQYDAYVEEFGDRCLDELKLESKNLADDPEPLLRALGQLAAHGVRAQGEEQSKHLETLRRQAEERVEQTLSPIKRGLFHWVLKHARARVRDRENLRFERTRVFGRVRTIFVELGRRFYGLGLLDDPDDVFFLEVEEVLGFISGTASTTDLKSLAQARKREFARFAELPPPAARFQTRGIVHQGNAFEASVAQAESGGELDADSRKGIGCCPGQVRAQVRVIDNPRGVTLEAGAILVAERTDPSWIMLFPFAAGVLVERGSLLSHAAIVSREMGIPSVVSIPGLTRWLNDGDEVAFDGATGVVRRLKEATHAQ